MSSQLQRGNARKRQSLVENQRRSKRKPSRKEGRPSEQFISGQQQHQDTAQGDRTAPEGRQQHQDTAQGDRAAPAGRQQHQDIVQGDRTAPAGRQ